MNRSTYYKYYSLARFMRTHGQYAEASEIRRQVKFYSKEAEALGMGDVKHQINLLQDMASLADPTERQARITQLSKKYTGEVYFYYWSRDCDLMESAHVSRYDSLFDAEKAVTDFYDYLENSGHCYQITKEEYDRFNPWWRDRAAEQAGY